MESDTNYEEKMLDYYCWKIPTGPNNICDVVYNHYLFKIKMNYNRIINIVVFKIKKDIILE